MSPLFSLATLKKHPAVSMIWPFLFAFTEDSFIHCELNRKNLYNHTNTTYKYTSGDESKSNNNTSEMPFFQLENNFI